MEEQVPLNPSRTIKGGIYARYSPGSDRDHTHSTSKLPDISTFQATPLHALNTPKIQKAAVGELIREIVVHPTAALEIQCGSNWVSDYSATGNRTPV